MSSALEPLALLIKQAQHRHHQALDAALAPLGISLVQWNALREIHRHPDSSQHRLAELTFNSDQSFGRLTTRLQKLKLVTRRLGVGRAHIHQLTEKGETLFHQGRQRVLDVFTRSFVPLDSQERALLTDLLVKLLASPLV